MLFIYLNFLSYKFNYYKIKAMIGMLLAMQLVYLYMYLIVYIQFAMN